ncbi:MAG TPA: Hpt domain-containing protein, partial [Burkholderiaceae bacterium]|nr:Hpt domain-containing protein [Burkholderiaceae bacterium]
PDLRGTARLAVFSAGLHGSVQTDLARYDIWRQLSKPVSAAELEECVLDAVHWAGRSVSPHVIAKHPSRQEDVNPLSDAELAAARDHFSGDLRLFKDFREGCLDQFAADLDRGNASILSLDLQDLRHLSHSLKSVLLLLGHRELSHTSRELEVRAADGDVHGSEESWNVLAAELERLIGKPHRR